ncbi:hypothetical protein J6590_045432 [Homalodisca vitripennis]|nr:hypothetical protein J6590_045432 [Homalodisca vitripennis]
MCFLYAGQHTRYHRVISTMRWLKELGTGVVFNSRKLDWKGECDSGDVRLVTGGEERWLRGGGWVNNNTAGMLTEYQTVPGVSSDFSSRAHLPRITIKYIYM